MNQTVNWDPSSDPLCWLQLAAGLVWLTWLLYAHHTTHYGGHR